jgi:hypothetical protein
MSIFTVFTSDLLQRKRNGIKAKKDAGKVKLAAPDPPPPLPPPPPVPEAPEQ